MLKGVEADAPVAAMLASCPGAMRAVCSLSPETCTAIVKQHIDLDRRVAAAVENLAGDDVGDVGHGTALSGRKIERGV